MTAIVNNARFSSNSGGNFQCSFSLILIPAYFTPPQCEWQLLPPMWKGALNFVFFLFPPWNLMWQSSSRARVVTEAHNKGGGFFFSKRSRSRFAKKKKRGSRIKMRMTFAISGGLLYASHWCAFSQSEPARGRICIANWQRTGPFHKWTGGPGAWFPHTPHPSFIPPPDKRPTPHHPVRKKTSARPSGPNRSHGGGGPAFSPEQAPTVGALFQQQGLGRVRVKGRGPAALTGCK